MSVQNGKVALPFKTCHYTTPTLSAYRNEKIGNRKKWNKIEKQTLRKKRNVLSNLKISKL